MTSIELPYKAPDAEIEALTFLAEETGLSRTLLKDAMTKGAVWLEKDGSERRLRRGKVMLTTSDRIALFYDDEILGIKPPEPQLVADLGSCSVWIKPANLFSAGSRFGDHCAIQRVIEKKLDRSTFLVHRLDRFVRGMMVVAHNRKAAAELSRQFEQRLVHKVYRAVVHGTLESTLDLDSPIEGRQAHSIVTPVEVSGNKSVVDIQIETGRKHQIRIHLSEAGFPIVGDRLYGPDKEGEMQLASIELAFLDPESAEKLTFNLPSEDYPSIQDAN